MKYWLIPREKLLVNALTFANKTGLFNPSLFSEIYFFLHNQDRVHGKLVDELCSVVRSPDVCRVCIVNQCIWNIFFRNIEKLHIERAPPCIRNAYFKRKFELVLRYFSFAFPLEEKATLSCREMIERKLCSPDKFCKTIKKNPAFYSTEKLKLKIINAK
ncbi:MAG: hypothetical protein KIH01_04845 [Candidatus Freyarchaeota archaeon]|nr:hypothetical protein [Candidatus Jordarchaeia archaeon]